jgi:hypothetical protein
MDFNIDEWLQQLGIKDFDELHEDEKETYFKMLEIAQASHITLEDFKAHVKTLREAVEVALATEKLTKMQDVFMKARLKNYLIFESFFDRPERAKKLLATYKARAKQ